VFTGLVQTTGVVRAVREGPQSRRVVIGFEAGLLATDREIGASVCVSGVCLTVTETSDDHFAADVAFETLAVTTKRRVAATPNANGVGS
jgi:riboflavin synthase